MLQSSYSYTRDAEDVQTCDADIAHARAVEAAMVVDVADSAAAVDDASATHMAAGAATAVVETSTAAVNAHSNGDCAREATAQRNDCDRDIPIRSDTSNCVCNEMNNGMETEASVPQNQNNRKTVSDPVSPELLEKNNKKNAWKYTEI